MCLVVLRDQLPEAMQDQPPINDLRALRHVRMGANHDVGAQPGRLPHQGPALAIYLALELGAGVERDHEHVEATGQLQIENDFLKKVLGK